MLRILLVFGTRPEAIKMGPLVNELKKRKRVEVKVCVTGQHKEMLEQVLHVFRIIPDFDLRIMQHGQSLADITSRVIVRMDDVLNSVNPDIVLVHGDTSTTFATALACYYRKIEIGHIEAGLRTNDLYSPFPEEFNRQAVSLVAKLHFAPTELAKENLLREGKNEASVYVTGNTVIDALSSTVREDYQSKDLDWASDSKLILLTAHRRENFGDPMKGMFNAVNRVTNRYLDVKVLFPVHYNPQIRELAESVFFGNSKIRIIEPLDVIDFHNVMARSHIVLTDSGGIQEEAPSLGIPVLVMRDTTERPEGIQAGTLKLIGTNESNVFRNICSLLECEAEYESMARAVNPYGDGLASKRIADILENQYFNG